MSAKQTKICSFYLGFCLRPRRSRVRVSFVGNVGDAVPYEHNKKTRAISRIAAAEWKHRIQPPSQVRIRPRSLPPQRVSVRLNATRSRTKCGHSTKMLSMCPHCRRHTKWERLLPRETCDLVGEGYLLHCGRHISAVPPSPISARRHKRARTPSEGLCPSKAG